MGGIRSGASRLIAVGVVLASLGGATSACSSSDDGVAESLTNGSRSGAPVAGGDSTSQQSGGGDVGPRWDDAKALAWIDTACAGCHGIDKATGTKTPYYSAWPMPAEGITRDFLEVNELTPIAYQTIRHALGTVPASPSPMPPPPSSAAVSEAKLAELRSMIDWFQRAVPYAVIDADARYGNDSNNEQHVVQFHCKKPSTLRTFLSRVTLGALDRTPLVTELSAFSDQELAGSVTPAQRQTVLAKLDSEWRNELMDIGVKKLATAIGGGPGVHAAGEITPDIAVDLRDELYQSFVGHYDSADYADYFTSNVVMVSPNTASLYGCEASEDGSWKDCTMASPRAGLFTTLGFLNSRPQSFLVESNNHGRVASLFFTLYGESLLAATDGPSGDATPPLPTCLEAVDTRTFQGAPRGSAAVPEFGKVCQSCHVSRHMAAGSVLFRPFSTTGQIYDADTLGAQGSPDATLVAAAVDAKWKYKAAGESAAAAATTQVDAAYLASLLNIKSTPCMMTGRPDKPTVTVSNVNELAMQLMSNRSSFARGFMRHAHRAFSNLTAITLEMSLRALTTFETGPRTLPNLIKMYFGTDSFACEANQ